MDNDKIQPEQLPVFKVPMLWDLNHRISFYFSIHNLKQHIPNWTLYAKHIELSRIEQN